MIDKILLYSLSFLMVSIIGYGTVAHFKIKHLNSVVDTLEVELKQAQADIKRKSFESKHDERRDNTNEDINSTLSDTSFIVDGNYSGV